MSNEFIWVRVLEHSTWDQIRAGHAYPINKGEVEKEAEKVKALYDKELEWCGGWTEENVRKYHLRIAIVDAKKFESVKEIWKKPKTEQQ